MVWLNKKFKAELAASRAESERKWLEQWPLGTSVKFSDEALVFFNSRDHIAFCKDFNKPLKEVRMDMVGKVIGGRADMRLVEVDFGNGPHSWAAEWLVRE